MSIFCQRLHSLDGMVSLGTPRHIIRMMVEMIIPDDEAILHPACGTSGFLVAAGEYLKEKKRRDFFDKKKDHYMNHMFYGYDMEEQCFVLGK